MNGKPVQINVPVDGPVDLAAVRGGLEARFINPYNFVPTPSRQPLQGGPLGDQGPVSQAAAEPGRYSGVIPIEITTRTPLLLPDLPRSAPPRGDGANGSPRTFGMRKGSDGGRPLLNGSAVKGMLRSAYETITNSRFGIVDGDQDLPGAIRSEARGALDMYPAVVLRADDDGRDRIQAVIGLRHRTMSVGNVMPAPWLPISVGEAFARQLGCAPDRIDALEVEAWLHLQNRGIYHVWRVSDIGLPGQLTDDWREPPADSRARTLSVDPIKVAAIVHWTGAQFPSNGRKKHDERLVVTSVIDGPGLLETAVLDVWPEQRRAWQGTIKSFERAHEDGIPAGHRMGTYVTDPERWDWRPGRTLHAKLDLTMTPPEIEQLSPAMIGRIPFPAAPNELILPLHRPARSTDELSPADRVFGWVRQEDDGSADSSAAVGGLLSVGAPSVVKAPDGGAIERLPAPTRIGTLNGPKSSQYRFYLGDRNQRPLEKEPRKAQNGYSLDGERRLRGRKFYLPHAETFSSASYWDPAATSAVTELAGQRRYREYMAAGQPKPRVDLATREWVRPGVTFRVDIRVTNLSAVEVGALLWLLAWPDACSFGLGLGKPLGFGAVRVTAAWDDVRLRTGAGVKTRYASLDEDGDQLSTADLQELVTGFDRLILLSSRNDNSHLSRVRDGLLSAARGYVGAPVHYPRPRRAADGAHQRPAPQGELFKWWVANENRHEYEALPAIGMVRDQQGKEHPLDPTLPYLDEY